MAEPLSVYEFTAASEYEDHNGMALNCVIASEFIVPNFVGDRHHLDVLKSE